MVNACERFFFTSREISQNEREKIHEGVAASCFQVSKLSSEITHKKEYENSASGRLFSSKEVT